MSPPRDDDSTLTTTEASGFAQTAPATEPDVTQPRRSQHSSISGYSIGELIGEGGMGEVLRAHDAKIDRDVAIKRMRSADPRGEAVARFLREAKIQARLDHPAIVPVHEVGTDDEGRPYFTMKRVTGTTMRELLDKPGMQTQRLLRAFVEVCLAIELAHSKGVVHRDLKPANIMLGDFGEVYVLDWGVARVLAEGGIDTGSEPASLDGTTQAGALLGTPGYMAPEQMRGEPIGRPADVYALGSILFEILTRETLHPRNDALRSTLEGGPVSPAARRPDAAIAPELDVACVRALAAESSARPTARELAECVQRYLDGDRDLEHRRTLAATELAVAEAALGAGDRATAMATAGRALALDPGSGAAALISKLMIEPPRTPPAELVRELEASRRTAVQRHARTTTYSFIVLFALLPLVVLSGVSNPVALALLGAHGGFMFFASWHLWRNPDRSLSGMVLYMLGHAVLLALIGRVWGPLIVTPVVLCMMIMSAITFPVFAGRAWLLFGIMMTGWLTPVILEQLGVLDSTWSVVGGALISNSHAVNVGATATALLVFGSCVAIIAAAVIHAGSLAKANRTAQEQLVTQAWQLRQLLPAGESAATSS